MTSPRTMLEVCAGRLALDVACASSYDVFT